MFFCFSYTILHFNFKKKFLRKNNEIPPPHHARIPELNGERRPLLSGSRCGPSRVSLNLYFSSESTLKLPIY